MSDEDHPDLELLARHVAQLGEHFDVIQLFASRHVTDESDPDAGTVTANYGSGNWHARRGLVAEWVLKHDEIIKAHARQEEKDD